MADKYVNATGVQAIKTWIEGKFGLKTDLEALTDRVDEIVSEGGEPNVIETVKVNGTALVPDAQKAVDVTVPTKTSDVTNDGDGLSPFATQGYVDENGGKIDVIKVNGDEQTITNKEVDIAVPTMTGQDFSDPETPDVQRYEVQLFDNDPNYGRYLFFDYHVDYNVADEGTIAIEAGVDDATFGPISLPSEAYVQKMITDAVPTSTSQLTNDSDFQNSTEVQELIDASLEGITGIDFQVVDTLPTTGEKGVIYLVHKGGAAGDIYDEYIWVTPTTGDPHYEQIGTTDIDLSDYWAKNELEAMTVSEINAILEPSA